MGLAEVEVLVENQVDWVVDQRVCSAGSSVSSQGQGFLSS